MARDRLPGVGSEASTAEVSVVVGNVGVGLGNQERPEAADVADLGRGFAEPAEVGRGLGQGGVVRIGRRADVGQQVIEDRRSRPRSGCWAGWSADSCEAQSMVWPASIWLTWTGIGFAV